jgi:hypothetical protein
MNPWQFATIESGLIPKYIYFTFKTKWVVLKFNNHKTHEWWKTLVSFFNTYEERLVENICGKQPNQMAYGY